MLDDGMAGFFQYNPCDIIEEEECKVVMIVEERFAHAPKIARFAPTVLLQKDSVDPVIIRIRAKQGLVEYEVIGHEDSVLIGKRVGSWGKVPE